MQGMHHSNEGSFTILQEEVEDFDVFSSSDESSSSESQYDSDSDVSYHTFSPQTSDAELVSDYSASDSASSDDENESGKRCLCMYTVSGLSVFTCVSIHAHKQELVSAQSHRIVSMLKT